ncbi:biotin--[acetyl-CoA-carboxylase] ligase [Mucilaginibacter hurinus]|uniref:Biotin--[acetyl-CoA-carboxylase] ligase n=1 Tax=Mucilaginibacter hurinus TaxID=2201324 RepID=A0A367GPX0_9SPHI|nr:biotin--[acetyl-CoA-carboxylase] ligase [Mucilaginibacter hurinus]RCH54916.1 biotin--[acetyl-CoA-carboxylase] ligase [Mucilaginibacter hurinus]
MQNNIFSGLFVGQNFVTLKEVDSTNNFLKNIVSNSKPVPEGTVIMAESQYAGRGQQHNGWHAEPGKNLTFSLLLNPAFLPVVNQYDLNRAVSLGVFNALQPLLGPALKIKWPNDIYYGDKKLGGILIENIIQGSQLKHSIAGIGINVNQFHFPGHLPNAVSVKQILHRDYDLKVLLSEICSHIEACYLKLKAGQYLWLRDEYTKNLYWLNETRNFKSNNTVFAAVIKEVKPNGLLALQKQQEEVTFNLKEIEFLINYP